MHLLKAIKLIVWQIQKKGNKVHARTILNQIKIKYPTYYHNNEWWLAANSRDLKNSWIRRIKIHGKPKCKTCGSSDGGSFRKARLLRSLDGAWPNFCSKQCSYTSDDRRKKTARTNLKRYGAASPLGSKICRKKGVRTNLKKYGGTNCMHSSKVRAKIKHTNLIRYGVPNAAMLNCTKKKAQKTSLMKYGTKFAMQCNAIQAKARRTNRIRRGVDYPSQDNRVVRKMRKTNLRKYGVEIATQSVKVREKTKITNLRKYGVENVLQSPEIINKIKQIVRRRYGVDHVWQKGPIRDKIRKTNLERYGFEYPMQNAKVLLKNKLSCFATRKITIAGIEHEIQGYEDTGAYWLDRKGFKIITMGQRGYKTFQYWKGAKIAVYFPDMVAISRMGKQYIVEVKSIYTAGLGKNGEELFRDLKRKAMSVIKNKQRYLLIICDRSKVLTYYLGLPTLAGLRTTLGI
jgi:hypothetical protein